MKHAKSFDKLSPAELREISRKAGIASGKARRKKRERIEKMKIRDRALQEVQQQARKESRQSIKLIVEATGILAQAKRLCDSKGADYP